MKTINYNYYVFTLLFTSYLLFGTGIMADEFGWIREKSAIWYPDILIATPILHYTHMLPLKLTELKYLWVIDILKILYINIFIYMIYKFISLFHSVNLSYLLSFVIVMFFLHDGVTFWFVGNYIVFAFAFVSYSYYLIEKAYNKIGVLVGFIGSFVSYSSPIFYASLSIGFLLKKDFRKFLLFSIAPVAYVVYYVYVSKYLLISTDRIHTQDLNILKQYLLQVVTYFDAISIAMLLKIFYLISDLSIWYHFISIVMVIFIAKFITYDNKINKSLLIIFISMLVISFFIFSLTGGYYQTPFSISNRIIFSTTVILVYLLIVGNKIISYFTLYITIITLIGTSIHWKQWSSYQMNITNNILKNKQISLLNHEILYLYCQNKSHLGCLDHLEFSIIYNTKNIEKVQYLNKSFKYQDNYLIKIEKNKRTYINDYIYIYFLEEDVLKKVKKAEINKLIKLSKHNYRHWSQELSNDNQIKKLIYKVMPSLNYER
jgi:hypothetical protein